LFTKLTPDENAAGRVPAEERKAFHRAALNIPIKTLALGKESGVHPFDCRVEIIADALLCQQ
jgi:hypothetical protein